MQKDHATIALRAWGKQQQGLNIGVHKLGSRGYAGKEPVWERQDARWAELGITNIFEEFKDPFERRIIRARYWPDKDTGVLITDSLTYQLQDELVINLHA